MANEIKLTISVDDKGSLKIVSADAKKAAKSVGMVGEATKKAGKHQDTYLRGQKGVAGATSNSTKAFSKMNQGLSGSTGLVQSYAILASNIFAATAAFNALRRVAQVEQLGKGLQFVGNVVGRDLKGAAERLTEITGSAVSMSQAMRTTAVGISAGFGGEQIEGLAKVAKGASIALGRDMADAMDRLVRGTAKLEPEILDELGILVRLDTAAQKYATQLGVGVTSLSQYERQQAFLNETLEQGLKKYEDIADAVDPNAYDKLSASLQNLAINFVEGLDDVFKLSDGISYLSENISALAGVVGVAIIPITKRLLPGMFNMAQGAATAAEETAEHSREMLRSIPITEKMTDRMKQALVAIRSGKGTTEDYAIANDSLTKSLNTTNAYLRKNVDTLKAKSDTYLTATDRSKQYTTIQGQLLKIQREEATAAVKSRQALALQLAGTGQLKAAFKELSVAKTKYRESLDIASGATTRFTGLTNSAKVAMFGFSSSIKLVGATILKFLPYIGLAITAITVLWGVLKDKFMPEDLVDKRLEEAEKSFDNFKNIFDQFDESSVEGGTRLVNAYIAWSGVLDEIKDKLQGVNNAVMDIFNQEQAAVLQRRKSIERELKHLIDMANRQGGVAEGVARPDPVLGPFPGEEQLEIGQEELREKAYKLGKELAESYADGANLLGAMIERQGKSQLQILQSAIFRLEAAQTYGDEEGIIKLVGERDLKAMDSLLTEFENKEWTSESLKEFSQRWANIQRSSLTIKDVFKSAQDAVLKFNQEMNKVQQREKGTFSNLIDSTKVLVDKFVDLDKQREKLGDNEVNRLVKQLNKDIKELNINEIFGEGREAVEGLFISLERSTKASLALGRAFKEQEKRLKTIKEVTKGIYGAESLRLEQERLTLILQRGQKEADLATLVAALNKKGLQDSKEAAKLRGEIAGINEQILSDDEISLRTARELLNVTKLQNQLVIARAAVQAQSLKNAQTEANIARGLGAKTTAAQDFAATIQAAEISVKAAEQEYRLTETRAAIERALLEARLKYYAETQPKLAAEMSDILGALDTQLALQKDIAATRVQSAMEELRLLKLTGGTLEGMFEQYGHNFGQQLINGIDLAISTGSARIEQLKSNQAGSEQHIATLEAAKPGLKGDALDAVNAQIMYHKDLIKATNNEISQSYIMMTSQAINPFLEGMRELGPEGTLAASIAEGALIMSSAFEVISNSALDSADRIAAVGSVVSAIGAIQSASSKQSIAAIDDQIEAEKRRDGKSKESLAKIASLEKKKEAEKRKAFEKDKKAKMASIVIDTAAGMMKAVGQAGLFGIPMMAIIAAMGAAQLAIVASQSYEGGSAGTADGGPSKVSLGDRNNTVDLARSRSPAGELAYMRGERGYGQTGANNYIPQPGGFAGKAAGGRTSFLVGEQGPELFIPDRPGTVVPADDTEKLGNNYNVNFSINAIDTQGMEEALSKQQDNIVRLIRDAANSHGEFFLENVK